MSKGHFVGLGDQTTCGGRILEGDPTFKLYGLLRALEGAQVTCANHAGTFRVLGGISNMRRNGKRIAGTLDSVSSCPCGARLMPSVLTATYEKKNAEPPVSQRVAQPNEATVNGNPVTPIQSGFTPSGGAVPTAFNGIQRRAWSGTRFLYRPQEHDPRGSGGHTFSDARPGCDAQVSSTES